MAVIDDLAEVRLQPAPAAALEGTGAAVALCPDWGTPA
jgi:hypothetical protein